MTEIIDISLPLLRRLIRPRPQEGHKGTFGHALLVAGSYGMAGASVLAGRGCMRSGAGKLTLHIPRHNNDIMQMSLPEAVLHHDESDIRWTSSPFFHTRPETYNAIGIGPGIGTAQETARALHDTLQSLARVHRPLVLDADALNLLAQNPDWFSMLRRDTIITPHPLELRRMHDAGIRTDNVILVAKGHRTTINIPGPRPKQYRCPWGNDGMATAGSGDVLTGIILGLSAQGYPPSHAAILGVSLHAIGGDIAARQRGRHSIMASDLAENIGRAFMQITDNEAHEVCSNNAENKQLL